MPEGAEQLCLRLAEETRRRIRADREQASVKVAELLEVIDDQLLHPDLDVGFLLRECGQRDKNVLTRFSAELGMAPGAYILTARMEIAARMLAESDFMVWVVGMRVGYLTPGSFSRAFTRWSGKSPKAFRAAAQSPEDQVVTSVPDELLSPDEVQQAVAGDLPAERAEILAERLFELGDRIRANYQPPGSPLAGVRAVESTMARNLWQLIEDQPYDVQKRAVESHAPAYRTACLFNRLCTVSIGAPDPTRGMQRANLAMISLQAGVEPPREEALNLFAVAWGVAGYAMRRAGELEDATQYFHTATRILEEAGDDAHPVVVAELSFFQATLELERGRMESAGALIEGGREILRRVAGRLLARSPTDDGDEP